MRGRKAEMFGALLYLATVAAAVFVTTTILVQVLQKTIAERAPAHLGGALATRNE